MKQLAADSSRAAVLWTSVQMLAIRTAFRTAKGTVVK